MVPRLGVLIRTITLYVGPGTLDATAGWLHPDDLIVLLDEIEPLPKAGWEGSTRRVLCPKRGVLWALGDALKNSTRWL